MAADALIAGPGDPASMPDRADVGPARSRSPRASRSGQAKRDGATHTSIPIASWVRTLTVARRRIPGRGPRPRGAQGERRGFRRRTMAPHGPFPVTQRAGAATSSLVRVLLNVGSSVGSRPRRRAALGVRRAAPDREGQGRAGQPLRPRGMPPPPPHNTPGPFLPTARPPAARAQSTARHRPRPAPVPCASRPLRRPRRTRAGLSRGRGRGSPRRPRESARSRSVPRVHRPRPPGGYQPARGGGSVISVQSSGVAPGRQLGHSGNLPPASAHPGP